MGCRGRSWRRTRQRTFACTRCGFRSWEDEGGGRRVAAGPPGSQGGPVLGRLRAHERMVRQERRTQSGAGLGRLLSGVRRGVRDPGEPPRSHEGRAQRVIDRLGEPPPTFLGGGSLAEPGRRLFAWKVISVKEARGGARASEWLCHQHPLRPLEARQIAPHEQERDRTRSADQGQVVDPGGPPAGHAPGLRRPGGLRERR